MALPRSLFLVVAAVGLVAGVGTVVQAVRIGHTGAEAAWSETVTPAQGAPSAPSSTDD